ncbi:hypothetical protein Glove_137g133 [Diversispora epigaea]|uniref:Uncharacterized protein n=1 Tax=Diversispora epigaea TaxID=1348612 RepID=A0A397J5C8_9GLOM|nr:hypothetical protein Glove_137g133 [Diversispora epigaea]
MTTYVRNSVYTSENKGGIGTSKKYYEKSPVRSKSTSDVTFKANKNSTNSEGPDLCDEKGCPTACQSILKNSKRIFDILTYFRLALALTLYILIVIDVIHIITMIEKEFWVECLLQIVNIEFTLFTIFAHPKRLANFPRAIKIYRASRKMNSSSSSLSSSQLGQQEYPSNIKEAQKRVSKAYEWYIYEGDKEFICPPGKLLIVLTFWNIGSFVQYGICAILWFIPQQSRPVIIYLAFDVISFICEVVPIPMVVSQSKRAKISRQYAVFEAGRTLLPHLRYRRSMAI